MKELLFITKGKGGHLDPTYLDNMISFYESLSDGEKRKVNFNGLRTSPMDTLREDMFNNELSFLLKSVLKDTDILEVNILDDAKILNILSKDDMGNFISKYTTNGLINVRSVADDYHAIRLDVDIFESDERKDIVFQGIPASGLTTMWYKWGFKEKSTNECKKLKYY